MGAHKWPPLPRHLSFSWCTAMAYVMVDVNVFTYKIKRGSQFGFCNSTLNPIKEGMSAGERRGAVRGSRLLLCKLCLTAPHRKVGKRFSHYLS